MGTHKIQTTAAARAFLAMIGFVLAMWARTASANCPYDPYVDCGDGSCCPSGDTCCGGASGTCCKPGSVCSNGQCVASSTSSGGSSGTGGGSSLCPNGQSCEPGSECCSDNLCTPVGDFCCTDGKHTSVGCHQGDTCCGFYCVSPGFICCGTTQAQGCDADTEYCCGESCCSKNAPASSNSSDQTNSGCALDAAPVASGSGTLVLGLAAMLRALRRRRGAKRTGSAR